MPCKICRKFGRPDYISSDLVFFECDACVRIHRDMAVDVLRDIADKAETISERLTGDMKEDICEIEELANAAIHFKRDNEVKHANGVYLCGNFTTPEQEKNDDD